MTVYDHSTSDTAAILIQQQAECSQPNTTCRYVKCAEFTPVFPLFAAKTKASLVYRESLIVIVFVLASSESLSMALNSFLYVQLLNVFVFTKR